MLVFQASGQSEFTTTANRKQTLSEATKFISIGLCALATSSKPLYCICSKTIGPFQIYLKCVLPPSCFFVLQFSMPTLGFAARTGSHFEVVLWLNLKFFEFHDGFAIMPFPDGLRNEA